MIIWAILGYLLLFIIFILILFIVLPIEYAVGACKHEKTMLQGRISCFWKIIEVNFTMMDSHMSKIIVKPLGISIPIDIKDDISVKKSKKSKKVKDKKKTSKPKKKDWSILEDFNQETISILIDFIKRIWKYLKPKKLVVKGKYGFDDPYYTAMGLVITSSLYPLIKDYPVSLTPSFGEAVLEGEFKIQGRIVIVTLLIVIIRLILSKPMIKTIKSIRKNKKEEKKYVS
ncbi:DUF2953 domain-containing protein [Natronincola ferrireducens]|uniref:DUF2953 domain-containing protein n=1 Tax=Natronincola ferrireducens TaxID=393762 RepID=A0A1G9AB33_9FIRM|nr:DUF2953 domain-containing protein [Natronincola ferrireducens]SDK24569.1 Protein of unknown function [Natronincola ferrireducens]